MKVYDIEITAEQIAAAVNAMRGEFRMNDVVVAIIRAGVPQGHVASRAVDRLLQRERRAGRILTVNNKLWRATGEEANARAERKL